MDQVIGFAKKHSKWIIGGVLASVVAVAAYVVTKSDEDDFVEVCDEVIVVDEGVEEAE